MGQLSSSSEAKSSKESVVPVLRRGAARFALPLALVSLALLAAPAAAETLCVGTNVGCDATYPSADAALAAATTGDRVVIRDQELRGLAVSDSGIELDARLNRWGTDSWRNVVASVADHGTGNTLRLLPFLRASDGRQDPPAPTVVPATHCSTAGITPIDLLDGLACAHAGGTIFLHAASGPDPAPQLGPFTVHQNSEGQTLHGLTICAAPAPPAPQVCDTAPRSGVVIDAQSGDTLTVRVDGLTLDALTLRAGGPQGTTERHIVEIPTSLLVSDLTLSRSVLQPDPLGPLAFVENGLRGRLADALVEGNEFRGFASAVYFRPYGEDNTVRGNLFTGVNTGVQTFSPGTRVEDNTFDVVGMAVDVAELPTDPSLLNDGTVLRGNHFENARLGVRNRALNTAVTVDARLNTWGTDDWRTIPPRIENTGAGNRVLFLPFLRATDGAQDPPSVIVEDASHCGTDLFLSVGEALACAHPGGTVRVQPSLNPVDPTPHLENLTLDQNSLGEDLDGLTLCATVAFFECARVDEPARWGLFSAGATWGSPPVDHTGQAIRIAGTGGSTSLFTRDALTGEGAPQVDDLTGLGFDVLRASGACPAGSPRITLRVDLNSDGDAADAGEAYQVYRDTPCPALGAWEHVDLLASANWGGVPGTTQAGAHAALSALNPNYRILSLNLIVDGGAAGDVFWFDNQRYQDSFFREASEETCGTATPLCLGADARVDARPGAILDGSGASGTVLRVLADDVTVQDLTLRVTDNPGQVVVADGTVGLTLRGNHIQAGEADPIPLTPTSRTSPSAGAAAPYYENPFVQEALASPALAAVAAARGDDAGFLFVAPLLTPVPHLGIAYSGPAPEGVPSTTAGFGDATLGTPMGEADGYRVLAYSGVPVTTAKQRLPDDFRANEVLTDVELSSPVTTAATEGIGPGTFIIMRNPDGNFRCTANFVWRNVTTGDLFLGAAGHCFSAAGAANSALRSYRIEVCIDNCYTDTVRCGTVTCTPEFGFTTAILRNCPHVLNNLTDELPSAPGTGKCRGLYSSGDNGAGNDFGAVQIPSQFYPLVRYSIPNFGGPTGTRAPGPNLGEFVVHYGHGAAFGELFPSEGRAGVVIGTQSTGTRSHFTFLGAGAPGDSGSDVAMGKLRSGSWFTGERAAGVLTHIALINTVQDPIKPPGATIANTIPRAIQMAQTGFGMGGGGTYNFCLMTIAADCVDVTPELGAGVSADAAVGLRVEGNTFALGALNSEVNPGADALRGAPLSGALIQGNAFVDWLGHGVAVQGGTGNQILDNLFERGCGGVLLSASGGNTLRGNVFGALACQGVHVTGTAADTAGNVLRQNDLRAPPVAVRVTGTSLDVDARLNDWADYDYRTLARRVLSEGVNNRVRQVPFIDVDGTAEPPLIRRWNGAVATEFLSIQEAVDDSATVAGTKIQVPASKIVSILSGGAEKLGRTPWLESVLLAKDGLLLCGQHLDLNDPCDDTGPLRPAIDATGLGSTAIRITGSGVTVQGLTVRVAAEPARAIDARGAMGVVLRDNTVEAGPGAAPGELLGGVLPIATGPLPLQQYFQNPFVAATYGTAAVEAIHAAHAGDAGLVAVVPSTYGHVALVYSGAAPAGVADGEEHGLPVKVYEHVTAQALAEPVSDYDPEALGITVLDADDFDVETGAPTGPNAPRTLEGIGPGSHILILWGTSGFRCTANFVFQDALGNYYLGTAGHCVFHTSQATQANTNFPGYLQPTSIQVCVANCQGGTLAVPEAGVGSATARQGTFLNLGANRVLYAQQTSAGLQFGEDFGWIRIPAAFNAQLRPYEWFWGGPTGSEVPDTGTPVVHYGHGRFLGETPFTQGRAGILAGTSTLGPGSFEGLGWVTGGDSGSAALTGSVRLNQRLVGDKALGDLTHSIVVVGAPLFIGTRVDYALDFLQTAVGADLTLVRETTSVLPAPVSGAVGIDISNTVGAVVAGNTVLGSAGQARPSAGVQGFNADDASILDNEIRGWQGSGVLLDGGATGNDVNDNRVGEGCTGVTLSDSGGNALRRNSFAGLSCKGVLVTSAAGGSASDGNLLRLNRFRGVDTPLQVENQDGITVDARANDWGVYEWQLVLRQAINLGDNDVPVIPYIDADGTLEPDFVRVAMGTCPARTPEAPETPCGFLAIDEALAYTNPGSVVLVRGSGHAWNPTPRFGQVTLSQNGVTLCSTPEGGLTCDPTPDTAILDAAGEGSVLVVSGTGSTVRGFALRAGQDGIAAVDLSGSTGASLRDNVIEAGSGAVSDDPVASASHFSGSGAGSFRDGWTREVLASEAFADLVAAHEGDRGFITAVPVAQPRSVALLYRGTPPLGAGAGETVLGAPVTAHSASLQPLARRIPDQVAAQIMAKAQAPDGPQFPGAPDGIGPGTLLIISRPDGTFGCTANWVYQNSVNPSEVYLGAAGHCFLAEGVPQGANPPATVVACIRGCDVDDLGLGAFGEYVLLGSVPYAIQSGESLGTDPVFGAVFGEEFCQVGCDFGVIRVPPALVPDVRPWMWFWRSPTGMDKADTGDVLVQYGYGLGVGMTFPTQARAYVATGTQSGALPTGARWLAMFGPAAPGDSGSAIATSSTPTGEVLRGDKAVGILTHIVLFNNSSEPIETDPASPTGAIVGTTVQRGIQVVQSAIGLSLTMVTEDSVLAPPPPPPPPPPVVVDLGVTLAGAAGATLSGNTVTVFGGDVAVGIANDAATTGAVLEDNEVTAGDIGVRIEGDGAVLRDNTITGPGEEDPLADDFGVLIAGGAENYLLQGNTLTDWAHAAVYVANPDGAGTLRGNTLSRIGRSAVLVSNDAASNAVLLEANTIEVNGLRGVNLEASVATVVKGNTFLLNPVSLGPAAPGSSAGVWLQGAQSPRLTSNVFSGSGMSAVAITDLVLPDGSVLAEPADVVLRRNLMRLDGNGFSLTLSEEVNGLTVDARLNDWGVYNFRALPARVLDRGSGNTVRQLPFLMPDGSSEPPGPSVVPSNHCDAAGIRPLDLSEAVACAHHDGLIVLHPSANRTDPTPWMESVVIAANSDGEPLDGLTLCSGPVGVMDCSQPRADGVVLVGRNGPALTVQAAGVRLKGLGFGGTDVALRADVPVDARENHWGVYRLSQVQARIDGAAAGQGQVVPFLDRDGRSPVLPPVAAFQPSLLSTDRLTPVVFADQSQRGTRALEGWSWTFGDGATSQAASPEHTYGALGTFAVVLTVRDEAELTSSAQAEVTVVNLVPMAQLTFGPDPANRAQPTVFTDASVDRDGSIVSWHWTFLPETTSTERNPSFQFERLGSFPVTLVVTDSDGATATRTVVVEVRNLAPTAAFAFGPEYPTLLQPVQFDDLSVDLDGGIQSRLWDFGDGLTSTEEDPLHAFTRGGWHHVSLRVVDADGVVAVAARDIYVCAPGGDPETIVDPEHIRLEFEMCLRVNQETLDNLPV